VEQKTLRQIIHKIGTPVRLLIIFSLLDQRSRRKGALPHANQNLVHLCRRIEKLVKDGDIISPPPLITGKDVTRLGYAPGPVVGHILHCVREKQIRGEIGDRKQAMAFLRETFSRGDESPR
jgi:hypothetical protein